MPEIACVNGVFTSLADAKVSIEDRGFQFADGVYEVVVAPGRRLFRLEQHLTRLKRSTEGIGLHVDYDALNLPALINEGVRRCGLDDVMVYIQITRGAAPRDHVPPEGMTPTVVMTFKAKPVYASELRQRGVDVTVVDDIRWQRCSIKSIALLPNVMLKSAARRQGFFDAIIVGPDGFVRETTAANVFIVTDGTLLTPPAGEQILHGVTRAYILECARDLAIPCEERDFTVPQMTAAEEVFISSSTMDLMPVGSIDGRRISDGKSRPVTERLMERFRQGMSQA